MRISDWSSDVCSSDLVLKTSYDRFLETGGSPQDRERSGLQEAFKTVFPIRDFSGRAQLEFVRYELEDPKYDVEECQQRGMTYAAPLKVTLRLVVWDVEEDTGARSIRDKIGRASCGERVCQYV